MYSLYQKHLYINNNYDFIKSASIKEYDIEAAGLNILIAKKMLTDKQIEYYSNLPKKERNIKLGLLQRGKDGRPYAKAVSDGLKEYRLKFFEANNIDENKVLSIRRDAIFVVNTNIKEKRFDNIRFRAKNTYSTYYQINKCDFLYSDRKDKLDIKGIDDENIKLQEDYLLYDIKKIIKLNQVSSRAACDYLYDFANKYRHKKLDVEYYRELDKGFFRIKKLKINGNYIGTRSASINDIDIRYNYLKYILPLINMIY